MKGMPIKYSTKELSWVSKNRTLSMKKLHAYFCKKFSRNDVSASNLKSLKLRNGWKTGRTGRYEKGTKTWNKGTKGLTGANKTSFKKGQRPLNWKPVGSTRLSKDGYLEIKTAEPKTWRFKHVILWEEKNGPIPDGFCVSFLDCNKKNIFIENLELISKNENLQINRLKPIITNKQTITVARTLGKLIAKTIDINKNEHY